MAGLWDIQVWNQFDTNISRELIVMVSESDAFEVFSSHPLLSFLLANFPRISGTNLVSTQDVLVGRAIPAPSARYKEIWND